MITIDQLKESLKLATDLVPVAKPGMKDDAEDIVTILSYAIQILEKNKVTVVPEHLEKLAEDCINTIQRLHNKYAAN